MAARERARPLRALQDGDEVQGAREEVPPGGGGVGSGSGQRRPAAAPEGEGRRSAKGEGCRGTRRGGDKVRDAREHSSERSCDGSEGSCAKEGEQEKAMAVARERAGELLGRCEGTVASLVAQLELVLSPEYVEDGGDENTVRTKIAREEGRRRSSA